MKKWIYNVLFILCVAVVVYAALKIYNQKEEYKKAETEYEQLQKKEKNIDFGELKKLNKDIVAWIKIPGTRINYPIVQGSDDEEYLHRRRLHQLIRQGRKEILQEPFSWKQSVKRILHQKIILFMDIT